jgi:hypothetical protein
VPLIRIVCVCFVSVINALLCRFTSHADGCNGDTCRHLGLTWGGTAGKIERNGKPAAYGKGQPGSGAIVTAAHRFLYKFSSFLQTMVRTEIRTYLKTWWAKLSKS